MGMKDIRRVYGVPCYRGQLVRVDGEVGHILSASGQRLRVKFEGVRNPRPCHPTWRFEYWTQLIADADYCGWVGFGMVREEASNG